MTNDHQTRVIAQIRELLDELEGAFRAERKTLVSLLGGPYEGMQATLARQPVKISVGSETYIRIDDPDTGETLDAYAWKKNV